MSYLYVGVDVGKQHHHIAVVDDNGTLISSERVPNDQTHLQAVIKQICHRRRNTRWAVDINTGPSSLLIALLHNRGLDVRYINGPLFAHIAPAFSGERKTDAATPSSSPTPCAPATTYPPSPPATPPRRNCTC